MEEATKGIKLTSIYYNIAALPTWNVPATWRQKDHSTQAVHDPTLGTPHDT